MKKKVILFFGFLSCVITGVLIFSIFIIRRICSQHSDGVSCLRPILPIPVSIFIWHLTSDGAFLPTRNQKKH